LAHHIARSVPRGGDRGGRGVPESRGGRRAPALPRELPELRQSREARPPVGFPRGRARARDNRQGPRLADSFRQRVLLQRVVARAVSADACRLGSRHRRGLACLRHERFQGGRRPGRPRGDDCGRAWRSGADGSIRGIRPSHGGDAPYLPRHDRRHVAAPGQGAAMDVPRPLGHAEGLGRDDPPAGGRHMKRAAIRIGVVFIEGTNCEDESVAFFRHLGAQAERVHLKQLTGNVPAELRRDLDDYDLLMIPGGFAAGDYVRAGTIFAARFRSKLSKDLIAFVRSGKPVFGVCNGFQVLVEAGLLPALGATMTAAPEAVLATNDSGHYECRPSLLKLENGGSCAFTRGMKQGRVVTFISAHAEGKFLLPQDREKKLLKELVDNDQVVFRFVDDRGKYAGYPWNPSGTTFNIAAICNRE